MGTKIGPVVDTLPHDLVGVDAYACMGVYTTEPLEIVPGDLTF